MSPLAAAAVGVAVVVGGFAAVGAAFTIGLALEARQRRRNQAAILTRTKRGAR